ncbi:MAG: ABC transporter permease [Eubacteriales bacterium]|nr:ABC transporter permease [Eubacteriales bacterium]
MAVSFKTVWLSLRKTKGFLVSMTVMPIVLIILVTLTLSYSARPVIGCVGNAERLQRIPGIRVAVLEASETAYFLGGARSTLVVYTDADGMPKEFESSVRDNPLVTMVREGVVTPAETVQKQRPEVGFAVGILLFKLMTAGSLGATLLMKERQNGTMVRIRNSAIRPAAHMTAAITVPFLLYCLADVVILLFYKVADFDYGLATPGLLYAVFTVALIFSTGIYTLVGSFAENEGHLWLFSTGILFPLALCSGVLFPTAYMPAWMRTVAKVSPQYYLQEMVADGLLAPVPVVLMTGIGVLTAVIGMMRFSRRH